MFLSLNCIAQPAWLEVTEQRVQVSDEVMQNWQENVFKSGKEFWTVGNFLKFHLFLNKIGLSLEQNSYIAKQMRQNTGDNHIETGDLFSFLNVPVDKSLRAYYFLDLEFLASLKIEQVQQIYQYME
ncbi:MAG: hypothetical protein VX642_05930, partial [Bdellovibrionota bacterium]|nr:hypothetical protein [Bdellovibrionota bacterium]